ncbi:hypothetical protein TraAM80_01274 [Trypanosoma rangeli]|uniref:Uncharacterized protein n=1 Tax=Trypanosoma rangeli TaxID=5698 RepID=A0A3S5ISF3_TRYRA|nr:uncharacterized protein TraAM80_01274 [Trypanosoma rangeli]RNF10890.1 hypothetical protein TraAM80_01274 [Trypanosoma rangeli]|eukprot:RNF10890.1 hypothetical protein TraAM80_01274 [Trypanosoma rangeli]
MEQVGQQRLPSDHRNVSFALKVAGWLVPDVRRHLFLLLWICGVPIHVQYVVHLLRMSAVPLEMAMTDTTTQTVRNPGIYAAMEAHASPVPPEETSMREVALDILFAQVAADCRAANAQVRQASLSSEAWSEVQSLSYRVDAAGVTQIVAQDATAKGEVLALLPSAASLEELEAMYFTAIDQARRFREQYTFPRSHSHASREGDSRTHSKKEESSRRHGVQGEAGVGIDVIIVDSEDDDARPLKQPDIVVLSDDDGGDSCSCCCHPPAKRRRGFSAEAVYEVVE